MGQEREYYIILLLGVVDKPIPTMWHIQKELFILSKVHPKIQKFFNFVKHYDGPYSQVIQEDVMEPMYFKNAYDFSNKGIHLTENGKSIFNEIKKRYGNNEKFIYLLHILELIRNIYDKLSKDELLFIIYLTYPDYIELSNKYEKLVLNKENRTSLAKKLYSKGIITKERYEEIIGDNYGQIYYSR